MSKPACLFACFRRRSCRIFLGGGTWRSGGRAVSGRGGRGITRGVDGSGAGLSKTIDFYVHVPDVNAAPHPTSPAVGGVILCGQNFIQLSVVLKPSTSKYITVFKIRRTPAVIHGLRAAYLHKKISPFVLSIISSPTARSVVDEGKHIPTAHTRRYRSNQPQATSSIKYTTPGNERGSHIDPQFILPFHTKRKSTATAAVVPLRANKNTQVIIPSDNDEYCLSQP